MFLRRQKSLFFIFHRLLVVEFLVEETGLSLTPCEMEMVPLAFAEEVLKGHNHIMSL